MPPSILSGSLIPDPRSLIPDMPGIKLQNGGVVVKAGKIGCACCTTTMCGDQPMPPLPTIIGVTLEIIDTRYGCGAADAPAPSGLFIMQLRLDFGTSRLYQSITNLSGPQYWFKWCDGTGVFLFTDSQQILVQVGCTTLPTGVADYGLAIRTASNPNIAGVLVQWSGVGGPLGDFMRWGEGRGNANGFWQNEQRPGAFMLREGETAIGPAMKTPGDSNTLEDIEDVQYRISWQTLATATDGTVTGFRKKPLRSAGDYL